MLGLAETQDVWLCRQIVSTSLLLAMLVFAYKNNTHSGMNKNLNQMDILCLANTRAIILFTLSIQYTAFKLLLD